MIQINTLEECCGCTACSQICPQKCIEMRVDTEGFLYPFTDHEKCVSCNLCNKVCPVINSSNLHPVIDSYASYVIDDKLRYESSSGGIFSLLAEHVLEKKGIVCSVRMSNDCRKAEFDIVYNSKDLASLRGSKYMQAYPAQFFPRLKDYLDKGLSVMFCGTPCQVNGFKLYLGKEYDNLLTVDIICHGVPTSSLWEKYVDYIEKQSGEVVKKVNFRCKKYGWEHYGLLKQFENAKSDFSEMSTDPYMQMFLGNLCLRPSCHDCKNKTFRLADITLGDFWGINRFLPEFNDGKGISAVIIRTEKGKKCCAEGEKKIKSIFVRYEDIIAENSPECMSVCKSDLREEFFSDLNRLDMKKIIEKYVGLPQKRSFAIRAFRKMKDILNIK